MRENLRETAGKTKRALFVFCLLCFALFWSGAALAAASSSGNTVVVKDDNSIPYDDLVAGGESHTADGDAMANDNNITVSGSDGDYGVDGGNSEVDNDGNATASGNSASVSGSNLTVGGGGSAVNGGSSKVGNDGNATANNNSVSFVDSINADPVRGGRSHVYNDGSATANGNSVFLSDSTGTTRTDEIRGGLSEVGEYSAPGSGNGTATANNNSVTVSNSPNLDGDGWGVAGVIGGHSIIYGDGTATASGNSVNFSDSAVNLNYYELVGGKASIDGDGDAAANSNSAAVSDSAVLDGDVAGGYAETYTGSATANSNSAAVSGSMVDGSVAGGYAGITYSGNGTATANNNSASINDSTVTGGGYYGGIYGGIANIEGDGTATASGNRMNVNGSTVNVDVLGGESYVDGNGGATANNNSVSINDSTVNGYVLGGEGYVYDAGDATANNNSVVISGGSTVDYSVFGGYAATDTGNATASGNRVVVSGSTVGGGVYGGYASTASGTAKADNNYVEISNSTINGGVYGGFLDNDANSTAINNTVTLRGDTTVNLDNNEKISGGDSSDPAHDTFSGNTLNILPSGAGGIAVNGAGNNSIENFGLYNFTFQADAPDGAVGLYLDSNVTALLNDGGSRSSEISVNIMGGGGLIPIDQTFTLFGGGGTVDANNFTPTTATGKKGVALLYNYDLAFSSGQMTATVTSIQVHPQAKALSEGRAAGAVFLNAGADLIAETGMSNAWGRQPGSSGTYTFGGASYANTKTDTGSHVDVDGFSVMGGLAKDFQKAGGRLTLGAFIEGGRGNYDAYNDFAGYASVNSSGDTDYYGLGIAARYDGNGDEKGRFYGDGALRFGKTETDFTSNLLDPTGAAARYDSDATYFGAHFGFGYVRNLSESSDLDLYTKLLWTRQGSDTVTISTGDPVEFGETDSVRWRTGLRYSKTARDSKFRYYIGAA
ncbi:MAG: hypothetical protein LBL05_03470, partial [Synergistaceae bacterium]|nr:hypothetical protein [Synergistaceae bacterium]